MRRPIRVYADTSVFGGVFDDEFAFPSRRFFQQAEEGRFHLVLAALVQYELEIAPLQVRCFFNKIAETREVHETSEKAVRLRDLYLRTGIVEQKSLADALHVAHATVLDCKVIVSWNFRHIVPFQKIPLYNEVNRREGYPESPSIRRKREWAMKKKCFDCVAMKREGARRVYEAVGGMTVQEEVEFWRQQTLKLRREIRKRKKRKTTEDAPGK